MQTVCIHKLIHLLYTQISCCRVVCSCQFCTIKLNSELVKMWLLHCGLSLVPRPTPATRIFIVRNLGPHDMKCGRGPGRFYHMSDVKGREKVERT